MGRSVIAGPPAFSFGASALALLAVVMIGASAFAPDAFAQVGTGVYEPGGRPAQAPAARIRSESRPEEPLREPPADAPQKLRELARAKVLARLGRTGEATKAYMELAKAHPKDQDVLGDMAEHFLDTGEPAVALAWINEAAGPGDRLQRLAARACIEGGDPAEAAAILERLIAANPKDAPLRIDLASAYYEMGDPVLAAQAARSAVNIDPGNAETRRYAQELEASLRPRAQASYQTYRQGRDATITTAGVAGRTPLSGRFNLNVKAERILATKRNSGQTFRNITATRTDTQTVTTSETVTETDPDTGVTTTTVFTNTEEVQTQTDVLLGTVMQGGQPAIYQWIDACRASVLWLGPKGLELEAGLSAFQGNGTQFGQFASARFTPFKSARVTLEASRNNPWYDPPEAAIRQGAYDQGRFLLEYVHRERTAFTLEGSATRYTVFDGSPYANRLAMTAVVARRLFADPELWLSYSFSPAVLWYLKGPQAAFLAGDSQPTLTRPISLATNEAIHQVAANIVWRPKSWIEAGLYAGIGQDAFRNEPFVFASPVLLLRPADNIEWESRAEYRNETRFLRNGGESLLLYSTLRVRM